MYLYDSMRMGQCYLHQLLRKKEAISTDLSIRNRTFVLPSCGSKDLPMLKFVMNLLLEKLQVQHVERAPKLEHMGKARPFICKNIQNGREA